MTHKRFYRIKQPLDSDQLVWLIVQIFSWQNLLFTEYGAINLWPALAITNQFWTLLVG